MDPELVALRDRYRAFMEAHVYPNEMALYAEDDAAEALIAQLRERARAEGLWAPHIGPEAGGTGRGFLAYAYLNEEIGRCFWAQLIFGCQAPDAGNSRDPRDVRDARAAQRSSSSRSSAATSGRTSR